MILKFSMALDYDNIFDLALAIDEAKACKYAKAFNYAKSIDEPPYLSDRQVKFYF